MSLNYFSNKPQEGDGKRYSALLTVQTFLWGRNHLPKTFVAALKFLIPDLDRNHRDPDINQEEEYD